MNKVYTCSYYGIWATKEGSVRISLYNEKDENFEVLNVSHVTGVASHDCKSKLRCIGLNGEDLQIVIR